MLSKDAPMRVQQAFVAMGTFRQFMMKYYGWVAAADDDACDFAVGNPHEMPLPAYMKALEKAIPPQNKDWYAYKLNEASSTGTVAQALQQ